MPQLTIRIKKLGDGCSSLTCIRPDGSSTWQRLHSGNATFFAHHDITHFAVETILGHRRGFYGLVLEGWDLSDFGTPWPRGPLPLDTDPSELIVGLLDAMRAAGEEWSSSTLAHHADAFFDGNGRERPPKMVTDAQLRQIRTRCDSLFAEWDAVRPGDALTLQFDPATIG